MNTRESNQRQAIRRRVGALAALALCWLTLTPLPASAANSTTVVSLTFDDGDGDQAPAAQKLTTAGMAGTFYITTGFIDLPGYLTRSDLASLAGNGHEIGGHTVTHPDLVQIDPVEAKRQICNGRATLQDWGFQPVDFAYPFASSTPAVENLAKQCGYNTARGLGDVRSPASCAGCVKAETLPPADPYYLKAPDQVDSSWTLAQLKRQVTQAVTSGGGWVGLTFHHVCSNIGQPGCEADQSITPATFNAFVDWLAAYTAKPANKTSVKTVDAVVRSYLGASYPAYQNAVPVPPRPVAAPGVNAIVNPSLETRASATAFPECFQPAGWGANVPSWSSSTPGHTGLDSELLAVDGYSGGDAKLMPNMDLGACTPSVTPGVSYDLSTWFTATGTSQYALYYRDASGAWFYWTSSPWFEPTTAWTTATFTTPPVPANATGVSFGLALISTGTLTTDDYSFVEAGTAPSASRVAPQRPAPDLRKPVKIKLHSRAKPLLPSADAVAPGTRVMPPALTQSGKG